MEIDLDALMAEYSTPAKVETPPENPEVLGKAEPTPISQPETVVQTPVQNQPIQNAVSSAPYGRYLTGKKAGQPRPAPVRMRNGQQIQTPVNPVQTPPPQITGATILDGGLFLTIINLIFPMVIALINNYFSDVKIDPKKLQLKDDQIKDLKQVTNDALKQVNLTGNPILILFVGLASAFAVNFMAVKMNVETKLNKPK